LLGEWTSLTSDLVAWAVESLPHQSYAKPRKNCWTGVKPATIGAMLVATFDARKAVFRPPLSAM